MYLNDKLLHLEVHTGFLGKVNKFSCILNIKLYKIKITAPNFAK